MNTSTASHLTYARIAGLTFLVYIAAGLTSMGLGGESPLVDLLLLLQFGVLAAAL